MGGGGGGLRYVHTYVGSAIFGGSKFRISILFIYLFFGGGGGVRKIKKILGCEHFVDFFFWGGGSPQNWAKFRGHFYSF